MEPVRPLLAKIDRSRVTTGEVTCSNGMPAFVAQPSTSGPHPVMVVLHER
jgi:dienelactone hydrolase